MMKPSASKIVPLDVFSVSDMAEWSASFHWPYSVKDEFALSEKMYAALFKIFIGVDDALCSATVRALSKHIYHFSCLIVSTSRIVNSFRRAGYEPICSLHGTSQLYTDVLRGSLHDISASGISLHGQKVSCKEVLCNIAQKMSIRKRTCSNGLPLEFYNPHAVLKSHAQNIGVLGVRRFSSYWFGEYRDRTCNESSRKILCEVAVALRKAIENISHDDECSIGSKLLQDVERYFYACLVYCRKLLDYLLVERLHKGPVHLWTGTYGHLDARLISEAVRYVGGRVTNVTEPGGITGILKPSYSLILLATCDRFTVYSENEIPLLKQLPEHYPLIQSRMPEICSISYDGYQKIFDRFRRGTPRKRIETVVYVPTCYVGASFQDCHPHDMVHLDWEYRMLKALVSMGYKVVYKKHRKGILSSTKLRFPGLNVEYNDKPFREVMHIGDAYVFDTIPSTAMYEAMCTQKPIVFAYGGYPPSSPESMGLLSKRCRLVGMSSDERNRLAVDEKTLSAALSARCENPNCEYLEKYLGVL